MANESQREALNETAAISWGKPVESLTSMSRGVRLSSHARTESRQTFGIQITVLFVVEPRRNQQPICKER
jgi:hypothetical protein